MAPKALSLSKILRSGKEMAQPVAKVTEKETKQSSGKDQGSSSTSALKEVRLTAQGDALKKVATALTEKE